MQSSYHKRLPFKITPQIFRYLNELSDFYEEFYIRETKRPFILRSYKSDEKPTEKNEDNVFDFIDYLLTKKIVEDAGKSPYGIIPAEKSDTGEDVYYVEYRTLRILDIKPIRKLLREASASLKSDENVKQENSGGSVSRLITMDTEGDFFRGKQKEILHVRNKNDGAYRILVAIYRLTDGAGGRVEYQKISEYMKINYKKEIGIKTISNAIDNTILRKYLINATPDGRKILERDGAGKSIFFYNPVLE